MHAFLDDSCSIELYIPNYSANCIRVYEYEAVPAMMYANSLLKLNLVTYLDR